MADTIRETPASPNAIMLKPFQGPPEGSNHNNSNCLDRQAVGQVALSRVEAIIPIVMEAARIAAALHGERLGATVSLSHGDMLGLPFYAVSLHPERTVEMTSQPGWEHLFEFAVTNSDLLFLPGYAIGTWFDTDRRLHVLDVVVYLSSVVEAIRLGALHGQRAIFDLHAEREISLMPNAAINFGGLR